MFVSPAVAPPQAKLSCGTPRLPATNSGRMGPSELRPATVLGGGTCPSSVSEASLAISNGATAAPQRSP